MDAPGDANATLASLTTIPPHDIDQAKIDESAAPAQSIPTDSDSDTSSSDDEDETPTEWLATSRAKRSTAGNRLNALLQQAQTEEDPEDELNLLFAEEENGNEDGGFSDHAGHDSDVQMDSSSDSEQSGPEDDLEGEKALQRQEKVERRAKQKKAVDRIPFVKKNVRIDPTTMKPPPPRPKKKSERVSWLPTLEDAPTRASARAATREKQVALHADLVDRELKRLQTVQSMERANAARAAKKKPALTQAERLAEAARMEKANKKSLSRWQESENQREEEQRAKLEALKNRKLDGPVITWWSGWSEWVGDRLSKVGKNLVIEDPKEKTSKKRKASEMTEDNEKEKTVEGNASHAETKAASPAAATSEPKKDEPSTAEPPEDIATKNEAPEVAKPTEEEHTKSQTIQDESEADPLPSAAPIPPPQPELPPAPIVPLQTLPPRSSVLAPPPGLPTQAPHPPPNFFHHHHNAQNPPPYVIAPPILDGSAPVPGLGYGHGFQSSSPRPNGTSLTKPATSQPQKNHHLSNAQTPARSTPPPFGFPLGQHNYHQGVPNPSNLTPSGQNRPQFPSYSQYPPYRPLVQEVPLEPPKPEPPAITNCAVNYLILQNFDDNAIKDKNVQTEIILKKRFQKQSTNKKPSHTLCAITSLPARYRDPTTGLPYANAYAFKELRKLQRGDYKWSKLVGCYVGHGTGPLPPPLEGERAWNVAGNGVGVSVVARGVPIRFANPGAKREVIEKRLDGPGGSGPVGVGQALRIGAEAVDSGSPNMRGAPTQSQKATINPGVTTPGQPVSTLVTASTPTPTTSTTA